MTSAVSAGAPPTVRLRDYAAPAWGIEHVDLAFDLDADDTRVQARLTVCRGADPSAPLHLDGEQL